MKMSVDRTPRLIDVRQIGPNSERDISGRCSACGVVLIARLNIWEDATEEQLRDKLEKQFARHVAETRCNGDQDRPVSK
jgi:hypothetical protein